MTNPSAPPPAPQQLSDNRQRGTLADALNRLLAPSAGHAVERVRIASAFFSPQGLARLSDNLAAVPQVRLLLGVEPQAEDYTERRKPGESEEEFRIRRLRNRLQRCLNAIRQAGGDRPFTREALAELKRLHAFLGADNLEARHYTEEFMHAKLYLLDAAGAAGGALFIGSSNLTGGGLEHNLELNLRSEEATATGEAAEWFESVWRGAEPLDLAELYGKLFQPWRPWEIYLRILWLWFGNEVEEELEEEFGLSITHFQRHAVLRARRLLRDNGGAIIADEVGLGKTFIAGEIMLEYLERRQRVLVVCPAALREGNWGRFKHEHQLDADIISFEQLAMIVPPPNGISTRPLNNLLLQRIKDSLQDYQLIVVDEAHNYRNRRSQHRAGALHRLLAGQRRDLLLLTATPVNNSLNDLQNLLRFFVHQDSRFAERGILSIAELFIQATQQDPSDLSPDLLFPLIDATTVKRTRRYIREHYPGDKIDLKSDGNLQEIRFPTPVPKSDRYSLEEMLPGFFDEVAGALDPDAQEPLNFARYAPELYWRNATKTAAATGGEVAAEQERERAKDRHRRAMQSGFLRSGLLKRFESSVRSFANSLDKMARHSEHFLQALDNGIVLSTRLLNEFSASDDDFEDFLQDHANEGADGDGGDHSSDAGDYDVPALRAAVQHDLERIQALARQARSVSAEQDPKLRLLRETLRRMLRAAEEDAAGDGIKERQNRKVLIFSFFKDTVDWVWECLDEAVRDDAELSAYTGRLRRIAGGDDALARTIDAFSAEPQPDAPQQADGGECDLLISTDVLAEGTNLQQCRNIINYDVPWNPMRLVQRHGRIDRIGSPHARVFPHTFFPEDRLQDLLRIEQRIQQKIAYAANSIGVDSPLENALSAERVFADTTEEIQRLEREDAKLYEQGGTDAAAQTGEEYRHTLREALVEARDISTSLPFNAGSGMRRGRERGILFCAEINGGGDGPSRKYLRFVRADTQWRPAYVEAAATAAESGTTTADPALEAVPTPTAMRPDITSNEALCLRLAACKANDERWLPDEIRERAFDFWDLAQRDILQAWNKQADPLNIQPKRGPLYDHIAAFIRANPLPNLSSEDHEKTLRLLDAAWPYSEERELRKRFNTCRERGKAGARELVEHMLGTGLKPVEIPVPLEPIEEKDRHEMVRLVCWMAMAPDADGAGPSQ